MPLLRCSIPHCGLLPVEDDPFVALSCFLPTCHLFLDFPPLGLTLSPSAPVFRCHRYSWTRGRLALAQEAVRVSSLSFSSIFFCSCCFLQGHAGSHRVNSLQAALKCEGFALMSNCFWCLPHSRCLHRTRPLILERWSALKNHDVLLRCV